jgi:hypothetical protein
MSSMPQIDYECFEDLSRQLQIAALRPLRRSWTTSYIVLLSGTTQST